MTSTAIKILCVDDEPQILKFLHASLTTQCYDVLEATTGREALSQAASRNPALIILDLGLPDMDGLQVTRRLREWSRTPIIVLTARDQEDDKVTALDAGADDYLTKPFGLAELLARIRVALRRTERPADAAEEAVMRAGELEIDTARHRVTLGNKVIDLTPTEFNLLAELARHADRVLTQRHLLEKVWGPTYIDQTHYLRVFMGQLRKKIEADPAQPRYLLTEPGVGYRLATDGAGTNA